MSNCVITNQSDVENFLDTIKKMVKNDYHNLQISFKNGENKKFLMEYGLSKEDICKIILSLKPSEFSEKMKSKHPKFKNYLYLFAPYYNLTFKSGIKINTQLYLKLVCFETDNDVLIVSIHIPKNELNYQFN